MTSKVNVQGLEDIIDASHRYKMSQFKIDKRKTKYVIINFGTIAGELGRSEDLLGDFLKKKFSISAEIKKGEFITTKELVPAEVMKATREFIEYMVLCGNKSCRNKETDIVKGDGGKICLKCKACPETTEIKSKVKVIGKILEKIKI